MAWGDQDDDRWLGRVHRLVAPLCDACVVSTEVDGGGVALLSSSGVRAGVYADDRVSRELEALQVDLGEGPCLDAGVSASPVLVADLQDPQEGVGSRWPFFLARVHEVGVRAVFAFPLRLGSVRLGTLALHRAEPGRLSAEQLATAFRAADDVGSAIVDLGRHARASETLDGPGPAGYGRLGRSAAVVHQAAGMVMVQLDSTIDEAMAMLRASAFVDGLTLIELSSQVVHGHRRISKEQI